MAGSTRRSVYIYINNKKVNNDIKSIAGESKKLRNEVAKLTRGTREYNQKMGELKRANKIIRDHHKEIRGMKDIWGGLKTEVKQFGALALGALGINEMINQFGQLIQRTAAFSDKLADVRKTTGLTEEEVQDLNQELGMLNTRSSRSELLGLARVAGKLGKEGKKDILEFVESADRINVALSEDLGGNVEETIRQLGKLTDLFDLEDIYGSAEALERTGSAINAIGASSTANEPYLVDFSKRVGGVAPQANISLQEILGLASALDQLGQSSEVSSTVFSQVVPNMFKDTKTYAEVARMSVEDFTELLNTDANEALLKVLEGLHGNNEGYGKMVAKLDALGLEGTRAISVLGALSGNVELVRKEQALANTEFEKGTSLQEEFAVKNTNVAAQIERVGRAINKWFINSTVMNFIGSLVGGLERLIVKTKSYSERLEDTRTELNVLVDALTTANLAEGERKRIIDEIQSVYPDFLENLDLEKASTADIRDRLREVNDELLAQIVLKRKDEEIEEQRTKAADAWNDRYKRRMEIISIINKAEKQYGITIDQNATLQEKVTQTLAQLREKVGTTTEGIELNQRIQQFNQLTTSYGEEQSLLALLNEEREEMREQLTAEGLIKERLNGLTNEQNASYQQLQKELSQVNQALKAAASPEVKQLWEERKRQIEENIAALEELAKSANASPNGDNNNVPGQIAEDAKAANKALKALNKEMDKLLEKADDPEAFLKEQHGSSLEGMMALINSFIKGDKKDALSPGEESLKELAQYEEQLKRFMQQVYGLGDAKDRLAALYAELSRLENSEGMGPMVAERLRELIEPFSEDAMRETMARVNDYSSAFNQLGSTITNQLHFEIGLMRERLDLLRQSGASEEQIAKAKVKYQGEINKKMKASIRIQRTANALTAIGAAYTQIDALNLAIKAAAKQGTAPFPANLPMILGTVAAIGSAIGAIRQLFADIPSTAQMATGGYAEVKGEEDGRTYRARTSRKNTGGWVGEPTLLVGERGMEYWVPDYELRKPEVLDMVHVLEAIRTGRQMASPQKANGGAANTSQLPLRPSSVQENESDGVIKQMMSRMIGLLEQLQQEGVRSYWEWDAYKEGLDKANRAEERSGQL